MNQGLFSWAYGAVLDTYRRRIKYGQGASKVNFEAVVLGTTDNTTGMLRSAGGAAPALSYADLVLQVPYIAGRRGQPPLAFGALSLTIPDGTTAGGNRRGVGAVDLQAWRAGAHQVASGAYSVIGGGSQNYVTGAYATACGGRSNTASGQYATTIGGYINTASGAYSCAGGYSAVASINRKFAWCHIGWIGGRIATTNATVTTMTSDGAAVSAANVNVLAANSCFAFTGNVNARNASTGDAAMWTVKGLIKRGASAAATAFVGVPTVTQDFADAAMAACAVAVTANTTRGSLEITVTGLAATTINWRDAITAVENY